jgi:fumarate hydratase subunit beta
MAKDGICRLVTPLTDADVENLHAGDQVRLSGGVLTARDAAHKRLCDLIEAGQSLPIDVNGQVIYYVGPTPPRPGMIVGSAGPTTGGRMDSYAPKLMRLGLKGMIGKGARSLAVREAMQQNKCVYFGAIGGAGVLLSQHVKKAEVLAYDDLGTEAIRRFIIEDFPVIVINDIYGKDVYEEGRTRYAREK